VRFWDTSALIPTLLTEPTTPRTRQWIKQDAQVAVWTLTRVELLSALARRRRERRTAPDILAAARRELLAAWEQWTEITALDIVRPRAERLVERHPLRAADALQIGAALVAADDDPSTLEFVTLDRVLAEAAEREGFRVLGP
jgi:predicted nucleic acid-binding protein